MSTGLKLGENWDDVPKFSVILSGTRDGGPYKREDFLVGLAGVIGNVSTRVLSFGPLVRNSEWYLVLQDQLSKDRMLLAGTIMAKGVSFRIRSVDKSQFVVRCTGRPLSCKLESIQTFWTATEPSFPWPLTNVLVKGSREWPRVLGPWS